MLEEETPANKKIRSITDQGDSIASSVDKTTLLPVTQRSEQWKLEQKGSTGS